MQTALYAGCHAATMAVSPNAARTACVKAPLVHPSAEKTPPRLPEDKEFAVMNTMSGPGLSTRTKTVGMNSASVCASISKRCLLVVPNVMRVSRGYGLWAPEKSEIAPAAARVMRPTKLRPKGNSMNSSRYMVSEKRTLRMAYFLSQFMPGEWP